MALKPIKVVVRDTQNILFDGEADRITSFNEVGRFDVFPMHANFISILHKEIALFKKHEKVKEMKIEQAVMKVKQDVVHIFLGIESLFIDENETGTQDKKAPQKTEKK